MSEPNVSGILGRVRRESYTGSNRCWPCTVLNAGLVVVVTSTVGILLSPLVGGLTFLAGVATVWLRGYLVPYTPWLTSRVFGSLAGTPVTHKTASDTAETVAAAGTDTADESGVAGTLLTAGVLVADGEELSLAPAFRDAWRAAIEANRPSDLDTLAGEMQDAIPWVADASVVTDDGRNWIRLTDEGDNVKNETWMAPPAAVADLTAVRTLDARTELTDDQRTLAAPPLRQFLERCPTCEDWLEVRSPRACCGSPRYVAEGIEDVLSCPTCDEIITVLAADEDVN